MVIIHDVCHTPNTYRQSSLQLTVCELAREKGIKKLSWIQVKCMFSPTKIIELKLYQLYTTPNWGTWRINTAINLTNRTLLNDFNSRERFTPLPFLPHSVLLVRPGVSREHIEVCPKGIADFGGTRCLWGQVGSWAGMSSIRQPDQARFQRGGRAAFALKLKSQTLSLTSLIKMGAWLRGAISCLGMPVFPCS